MPAWRGLIGLSGNATFVDGGGVDVPTFRICDRERSWVVENKGVAPDPEVLDVVEKRLAGGDPSLEKGVEILLGLGAHSIRNPAPGRGKTLRPRGHHVGKRLSTLKISTNPGFSIHFAHRAQIVSAQSLTRQHPARSAEFLYTLHYLDFDVLD
jgi:hypothetical protein